jgi:hypothetical protein
MVDRSPWLAMKLTEAWPMATLSDGGLYGGTGRWRGRWIELATKLGDGGTMAIGNNSMGARVRGAFDENVYGVEEGGSRPLF